MSAEPVLIFSSDDVQVFSDASIWVAVWETYKKRPDGKWEGWIERHGEIGITGWSINDDGTSIPDESISVYDECPVWRGVSPEDTFFKKKVYMSGKIFKGKGLFT